MIDRARDGGQTNLEYVGRERAGDDGSVKVPGRNQLHVNPEDAISACADACSEMMRALREIRPAENVEKNEIDAFGNRRRRFPRSSDGGQSARGLREWAHFRFERRNVRPISAASRRPPVLLFSYRRRMRTSSSIPSPASVFDPPVALAGYGGLEPHLSTGKFPFGPAAACMHPAGHGSPSTNTAVSSRRSFHIRFPLNRDAPTGTDRLTPIRLERTIKNLEMVGEIDIAGGQKYATMSPAAASSAAFHNEATPAFSIVDDPGPADVQSPNQIDW